MSGKSGWKNHMVFWQIWQKIHSCWFVLILLWVWRTQMLRNEKRSGNKTHVTVQESPPPLLSTWWDTLSDSAWDTGNFPSYRHQVYPSEMHCQVPSIGSQNCLKSKHQCTGALCWPLLILDPVIALHHYQIFLLLAHPFFFPSPFTCISRSASLFPTSSCP